ncbi:MAG: hypothetical protein Q7S21_07540 [archaeon]|nr:hypothetical protein [archaeon]
MVELLVRELSDKLNEFHEFAQGNEWKNLSRAGFVAVLNESIDRTEDLHKLLMQIDVKMQKFPSINKPKLDDTLKHYRQTLSVLQNNLFMEQEKKENKDFLLNNQIELPELYSSLQNKVLELLVKTRFAAEKLHFHSKTEQLTPLHERETMQKLIQLLKTKEDEIEQLKTKFDSIKHQEILARMGEKTSHDLEQDLQETARKLEVHSQGLKKELLIHRKQLDFVNDSHAVLHQKSQLVDELTSSFLNKSMDLITALKKERDYEKQLVLEIENETLKIRSMYSKELLNLETHKVSAKTDAMEAVQEKLRKFEEEIKEKDKLLNQFDKIINEKEKQLDGIKTKQSIREAKKL